MRNRIIGGIAALWGGGIVIFSLKKGLPHGAGGYAAGEVAGTIFGAVTLILGIYYLIKGD